MVHQKPSILRATQPVYVRHNGSETLNDRRHARQRLMRSVLAVFNIQCYLLNRTHCFESRFDESVDDNGILKFEIILTNDKL